MARNNVAVPRHLLVLRLSAMGDVAMLPHALRALRTAWPDLRVTVATRPLFRPFFAGIDVDFLDVDPSGAQRSLAGMWRLAAVARERGVDAVADVHGTWRSKAFCASMRLHGIPAASIDKGRREKRRVIAEGWRAAPVRHTVLRYCDVFRRLGFSFDDPCPAGPVGPAVAAPSSAVSVAARRAEVAAPFTAVALPQELSGEKRGVWVGVAPFSAHRGKTYPEERAREVIGLLAARCERVFVHSGGGAEADFARAAEAEWPNVVALHGRVTLAQEIALIARMDCLVTMDSLAMHLASLTATPAVSVWGATCPALGFLGWGGDAANALQADLACRPCSRYGAKPCRYDDYRCMQAVDPERIVDRVAEVVGL